MNWSNHQVLLTDDIVVVAVLTQPLHQLLLPLAGHAVQPEVVLHVLHHLPHHTHQALVDLNLNQRKLKTLVQALTWIVTIQLRLSSMTHVDCTQESGAEMFVMSCVVSGMQ